MKCFDHLKSLKNPSRSKKNNKKYIHKIIRTKGCSPQQPIFLDNLENVNEILRVYRSQRAVAKGNWKVVPKDSCEIYRERKKRQMINERRSRKQDSIDKKNEDAVEERVKVDQRKQRRKMRKKGNKRAYRKNHKNNKHSQRYSCESSLSSYTSPSITTSCSSYSDMDLD